MKSRSEFADLFMPWAGLAAGVIAAGVTHQFGSEGVFDNCAAISPIPILAVNILGIVLTVVGALASWSVLREGAETHARKAVAFISVGAAALFVFAILLPTIASLVIPPCYQ